MAVTKAFYDAVNSGDLLLIHIMMKSSLLVDRTFKDYSTMEQAASILPGLYVPFDGRELKQSCDEWNDDYMNEMLVQLLNNFSRERVGHLKRIITYLHPPMSEDNAASSKETKNGEKTVAKFGATEYQKQKQRDQESGAFLNETFLWSEVGATAAGAATGGIATAMANSVMGTSVSILGGCAIGAAAGAVGAAAALGLCCLLGKAGK